MRRKLLLTGFLMLAATQAAWPQANPQVFAEVLVDVAVSGVGFDRYGIQLTVTRGSFSCGAQQWVFQYQYTVRHISTQNASSGQKAFFKQLQIPVCNGNPFCAVAHPEVRPGSATGGNVNNWIANNGLAGGQTSVVWQIDPSAAGGPLANGMPDGGVWRFTFYTNAAPDISNRSLAMNESHCITAVPPDCPEGAGTMQYVFPCGALDSAGPPRVACALVRVTLWPPDHDLVDVGLAAGATSDTDPAPVVTIRVFSNEADETPTGDGAFSPDARPGPVFSPAQLPLRLRAERKGNDDGRVYLILVTATDHAGNVGRDCCAVTVPHDQSQAARQSVADQAAAAQAFCAQNGTAPPGFVPVGGGAVIGPKQ